MTLETVDEIRAEEAKGQAARLGSYHVRKLLREIDRMRPVVEAAFVIRDTDKRKLSLAQRTAFIEAVGAYREGKPAEPAPVPGCITCGKNHPPGMCPEGDGEGPRFVPAMSAKKAARIESALGTPAPAVVAAASAGDAEVLQFRNPKQTKSDVAAILAQSAKGAAELQQKLSGKAQTHRTAVVVSPEGDTEALQREQFRVSGKWYRCPRCGGVAGVSHQCCKGVDMVPEPAAKTALEAALSRATIIDRGELAAPLRAAVAYVVAMGPCDGIDIERGDDNYCAESECCPYCDMARRLDRMPPAVRALFEGGDDD